MRVAGLGYSDGARNLEEVSEWREEAGDTGRRNSYGSKKKLFKCSRRSFGVTVSMPALHGAVPDYVEHYSRRPLAVHNM